MLSSSYMDYKLNYFVAWGLFLITYTHKRNGKWENSMFGFWGIAWNQGCLQWCVTHAKEEIVRTHNQFLYWQLLDGKDAIDEVHMEDQWLWKSTNTTCILMETQGRAKDPKNSNIRDKSYFRVVKKNWAMNNMRLWSFKNNSHFLKVNLMSFLRGSSISKSLLNR